MDLMDTPVPVLQFWEPCRRRWERVRGEVPQFDLTGEDIIIRYVPPLCAVCFDNVETVPCYTCDHGTCRQCWNHMFDRAEREDTQLMCPHCRSHIEFLEIEGTIVGTQYPVELCERCKEPADRVCSGCRTPICIECSCPDDLCTQDQ